MIALLTSPTHAARIALTASLSVTLTLAGCSTGTPDATPAARPVDSMSAQRPPAVPMLPRQLVALPPRPGALVQGIAVRRDTTTFGTGRAVVTLIGGDSVIVSDSAVRAWAFAKSGLVAVSGLDGAGGYENEGQSLTAVDLTSGNRRVVVADYFAIVRVELVSAGATSALLVHMRDGGAGSVHVTVVDPQRGQVFRATNALGHIEGARVIVSSFGDGDTPVTFGDKRTPLRIDTIPLTAVDTMSLLVIPRSSPR